MSEILDLNPEQKKAFNRLKRAWNDCKKLNVYFANNYGTLMAYDKKYVEEYCDNMIYAEIESNELDAGDSEIEAHNSFYDSALVSWCDDSHKIRITEEAIQILKEENE